MRVTQNNPLRGQNHRINVDLWMIDLLLDKQLNLLTRPKYLRNVRRDVSQDPNLPASFKDNRQYLFFSTQLSVLKNQNSGDPALR